MSFDHEDQQHVRRLSSLVCKERKRKSIRLKSAFSYLEKRFHEHTHTQ
jgi:hypothetical protein